VHLPACPAVCSKDTQQEQHQGCHSATTLFQTKGPAAVAGSCT
jgi:hypothetical protein